MNLLQPLFSVLPRSKAAATLLAVSLIMATVATTLVAAVPLYSDAIIEAGLRSTLVDAPPADSGLEATFRDPATNLLRIQGTLDSVGQSRLPGESRSMTVARSDTFTLPEDLSGDGFITSIGTLESDEEVFRTVEGPVAGSGGGNLAASLHVDAAEFLGVEVGDQLELTNRTIGTFTIDVIATVEPVDRFDELWFDQPTFRDGLKLSGSFTEVGPFLLEPAAFARLPGTANYRWRVIVEPDSVSTDDLAALRRGVGRMRQTLGDRFERNDIDVTTGLPALLAATDTAIGATAAVIAAILIQLVGVALYGVGLSASVLASSRSVETSMLRSRGASAEQLGTMAASEATLIALPAVLLGPKLGELVVEAVERWGPVATTGLDLRPVATSTALLASIIVGVFVIAIVTWPSVRSARGFASTQAERARPEGPGWLQRTGIDIGLALLAVLGLWRLSQSSASTSDLAGRLGTDPVLVLAPTLGVVAASLLTLRLIAVIARAAQRLTAQQGALSWALAGWELARRPGRTARTSVLIVLSVTVGTFAAVHGASWQRSLLDQADARVSADAVVEPDARPSAVVPTELLAIAYGNLPGVHEVMPVDRPTMSISAELGQVPVVAVDTRQLDDVLRVRADLIADADAVAQLRAPPDNRAIALGEVDGDLVFRYELERAGSETGGSIKTAIVITDRYGTVHRVEGGSVPVSEPTGTVAFPLVREDVPGTELRIAGPVELIEIEIAAPAIQDSPLNENPLPPARFTLRLSEPTMGERPVELAERTWVQNAAALGNALAVPSAAMRSDDTSITVELDTALTQQTSASFNVAFGTAPFGGEGFELPVMMTPALLDATQLAVGDVATARVAGAAVDLRIVGVIPVVPFAVDEPVAALVDWATLSADRYAGTRRLDAVDSWALAADAESADELDRILAGEPFSSVEFAERRQTAREIARAPVTVGLSGSLGLALVASSLIAAIGLVLTAVVGARERRPAFAVLRAMGTRAGELRRWLLFETVPLVGLSALVGLASGIALARLALPSLAISSDGSRSIPSPVLVVPWLTLAGIAAIAIAAGMALPVVTARLLRRHRTADELRIGDTT